MQKDLGQKFGGKSCDHMQLHFRGPPLSYLTYSFTFFFTYSFDLLPAAIQVEWLFLKMADKDLLSLYWQKKPDYGQHSSYQLKQMWSSRENFKYLK